MLLRKSLNLLRKTITGVTHIGSANAIQTPHGFAPTARKLCGTMIASRLSRLDLTSRCVSDEPVNRGGSHPATRKNLLPKAPSPDGFRNGNQPSNSLLL